jgi:hypothetical protein
MKKMSAAYTADEMFKIYNTPAALTATAPEEIDEATHDAILALQERLKQPEGDEAKANAILGCRVRPCAADDAKQGMRLFGLMASATLRPK